MTNIHYDFKNDLNLDFQLEIEIFCENFREPILLT
jgi:hypothetical protein